MCSSTLNVRKREASIAELGVPASQFLDQFQSSEEATAVLCIIPAVRHTSVILVSPKQSLHCAVRSYPRFMSGVSDYTSGSLVSDQGFYERFTDAFRSAGIERERIPRVLFFAYANYGAYGETKRLPPIGKRSPLGLALDKRVESSFVPDERVSAVIAHWESQLHAFGNEAFAALDTDINEQTLDPANGIDGIAERVAQQSEDYWALFANAFPNAEIESRAMKRLRTLADDLGSGRSVVFDLFVGHWVKRSPSLWIRPGSADPKAWARLELRSTVLRRLSKVWHYSAAVSFLDDLPERLRLVSPENAEALENAVSNVRQYIANTESRFPVILENPMK